MPLSALPEHLRDVENHFPDDDQYGKTGFGRLYRWYQKTTKTWFAFSFRCTEWWARWRLSPGVLFAARGKGDWRWEDTVSEAYGGYPIIAGFWPDGYYLSRVQYYTRWHLAIQWPLMVSFHVYPKASDVPVPGQPRSDSDGKLWFFYWNHYDGDLVYWMLTSIYLGRNWK